MISALVVVIVWRRSRCADGNAGSRCAHTVARTIPAAIYGPAAINGAAPDSRAAIGTATNRRTSIRAAARRAHMGTALHPRELHRARRLLRQGTLCKGGRRQREKQSLYRTSGFLL